MGNEGQKICGDLPETTAFKSYAAKQERRSQYANYSDLPAVSFLRLTHSEASEGYPTIVNNIQPCPKLCLPMPLAYVGARTDSTSYTATREAWPISAHAHWRSRQDMLYLRRGFSTLVLLVSNSGNFALKGNELLFGSCSSCTGPPVTMPEFDSRQKLILPSWPVYDYIVNPRRACAARVTVVVRVRLSVR